MRCVVRLGVAGLPSLSLRQHSINPMSPTARFVGKAQLYQRSADDKGNKALRKIRRRRDLPTSGGAREAHLGGWRCGQGRGQRYASGNY